MSELPKCRLCGRSPVRQGDGTLLHEYCGCVLADADPMTEPEWRTLMGQGAPVAWAATDETGLVVEALGFNQSRRFDTPLYRAAPPQAQGDVGFGGQPLVVVDDPSTLGKLERFLLYVHLTIDSLDVPENVLDEIHCEARELVKELNLKCL